MKYKLMHLVTLFILLTGCFAESASERATRLERLTMSGVSVDLDEWFVPGVENSNFVRLYGGPAKMAADSEKRAKAEGGVKKIEILSDRELPGGNRVISVRTTFGSGKSAESEETWTKAGGKWKITPPKDE